MPHKGREFELKVYFSLKDWAAIVALAETIGVMPRALVWKLTLDGIKGLDIREVRRVCEELQGSGPNPVPKEILQPRKTDRRFPKTDKPGGVFGL